MNKKFKSKLLIWTSAGGVTACFTVFISAFTIYPGLQEVLPENFLSACIFFGGPGLIAGFLIRRFSKHWLSSVSGFAGVILGVLWHLHLSELSANIANTHYDTYSYMLSSISMADGFFLTRWIVNFEYRVLLCKGALGILVGLGMLLSPVFMSILGTFMTNNIMKNRQGKHL